jgi:tRNA (mo5U34)-methyltransferase
VLDLGCGEGVYAIEAGLRGAEVVALDARTERMRHGAACAEREGLGTVKFIQEDVRRVTRESFGLFDVVYFLGLLYHLDAPDVFSVMENVFQRMRRMLVVDTLISLEREDQVRLPWTSVRFGFTAYSFPGKGRRFRKTAYPTFAGSPMLRR